MIIFATLFFITSALCDVPPQIPQHVQISVMNSVDTLRLTWNRVTQDTLGQTIQVTGYQIYSLISDSLLSPYTVMPWSLFASTSDTLYLAPFNRSQLGYSRYFHVTAKSEPRAGEEWMFPLGNSGMQITMCWIPSGSFLMGSSPSDSMGIENESPQHQVTFSYGFWMSKYEVTQAQWRAVMSSNPSSFFGDSLRPVETVSFDDAQAYLDSLGGSFRLPSEAEWEYACRAGSSSRYFWGNDTSAAIIDSFAWCEFNSSVSTHRIGTKLPNPWGLHDIIGNVWEWTLDTWHENYVGAPSNGSAWTVGFGDRILRGGSYFDNYESMRNAYRSNYSYPDVQAQYNGIRLVR